jgi:hypothetical protein
MPRACPTRVAVGPGRAEAFDPSLDWKRIAQFKEWWGGKLILKGILEPEDARRAAEVGADAIVVSNHGGRQLDGAISSIRMLPPIMDAVGDRVEVHLDSGIRSGQDVLKAVRWGRGHLHRPRLHLWAGRDGRGRGDEGAGGHPQGTGPVHGAVRRDATSAMSARDILLVPRGFSGDWA